MVDLIRRATLVFFSFLEKLLQGPADETHDKKDDDDARGVYDKL